MQESTLGDEDNSEISSSVRVPKGLSFGAKSSNSVVSNRFSSPVQAEYTAQQFHMEDSNNRIEHSNSI